MFTKKDRQIANQKAMIKNRDELTEEQSKRISTLEANIKILLEENTAVYEENKDLRFENKELNDELKEVLKLAEGNAYNNEKIVLSKIIEVIRRQTK